MHPNRSYSSWAVSPGGGLQYPLQPSIPAPHVQYRLHGRWKAACNQAQDPAMAALLPQNKPDSCW